MKAWLTLLVTVAFCVSPFLTEGFGGFRPDQYPVPQIDPPVQPAGYAFSIWGVIYLWLLASAVLGVWKYRDDPDWEAARWPLILSLGAGAFWIETATRSAILATVLIWLMLIPALIAVFKARGALQWGFALPVGLYAGWLSAASLVSVGLLGAGHGIAFGPEAWAVAILLIAMVGLTTVTRRLQGIWSFGVARGMGPFRDCRAKSR